MAKGGAKANFNRQAITDAIVEGCARAALMAIIKTQAELKINLSQAGTGIKHPGLKYRSSAPGRSPAVQTGHLRRSWQVGKPRRVAAGNRLGWMIGSNQPYAARLEFGGGKIFPRPYVRPALRKVSALVGPMFTREIGNSLRKAGITRGGA